MKFNLNVTVKRKKYPKRTIFNFKKAIWDKLNEDLNSINWSNEFHGSDPENDWKKFKTILSKLCYKHIPTVSVGSKMQPPWFDSETFHLCREKEFHRSKFKKSKNPIDYEKFKEARKKFVKTVKEKQRATFEDPEDPSIVSKFFGVTLNFPQIVHVSQRLSHMVNVLEIILQTKRNFLMNYFMTNFLLLVYITYPLSR